MSFSIAIVVDQVDIESNSVTLTNIMCLNGAISTDTNLVWNTNNAHKDSEDYCGFRCSLAEKGIVLGIKIFGSLAVLVFGFSLFWFNGRLKENINSKVILIAFVAVTIGIMFVITIADNLFSYCGV